MFALNVPKLLWKYIFYPRGILGVEECNVNRVENIPRIFLDKITFLCHMSLKIVSSHTKFQNIRSVIEQDFASTLNWITIENDQWILSNQCFSIIFCRAIPMGENILHPPPRGEENISRSKAVWFVEKLSNVHVCKGAHRTPTVWGRGRPEDAINRKFNASPT